RWGFRRAARPSQSQRRSGGSPSVLSIEAGNAIALLGQSDWVAGFLALDRKRIEWWALLPQVIWLAGVFLPWVNSDYSNRVVLY
ncbi:GGDEF domain-containing protein, partial [Rhizobium ruizarguesonis]